MTAAAVRAGLEALARSALDSAALAERVASAARRYGETLRSGRTLFFCGNNVECHDGDHSPVHGHRYRHLSERNAIKKYFHVLHRIDGDASFAHIARHAGMIGIITAVCRQIESD